MVIGSFAVAAAIGIFTLLDPGDFSDTEARVMLTTLVIGVESILALCYLAVADGRWRAVGVVGGAVSLATTAIALVMVWGDAGGERWKVLGIAIVVSAALAQASLLLALADRPRARVVLWLTLATTVLVAALTCAAILADGDVSSAFWRTFGVLAILDVLGSIVLTALGLAGRRAGQVTATPNITLSPATMAIVAAAASTRGVTADQLVRVAVERLPADDITAT